MWGGGRGGGGEREGWGRGGRGVGLWEVAGGEWWPGRSLAGRAGKARAASGHAGPPISAGAGRSTPRTQRGHRRLALVALLDLQATTVTADALHSTRKMARAIRQQGGDYVLALKGNRGPLYQQAKDLLAGVAAGATEGTEKPLHGRRERRQAAVMASRRTGPNASTSPASPPWHGSTASARPAKPSSGRAATSSSRACSPPPRRCASCARIGASKTSSIGCSTWADEDRARTRKDHGAENLALLRRLALNLLQSNTYKDSIRRKIKRADGRCNF